MTRAIPLLSVLIAAATLAACGAAPADAAASGSGRVSNGGAADAAPAGVAPAGVAPAEAGAVGAALAGPSSVGAQPPRPASLVRRWVPLSGSAAAHPRPSFVEFRPDGTWIGSDGCNGLSGTWAARQTGQWQATLGPSTKIFCDNVPVGLWVERAARVSLDGDVLVLLDGAGQELGRLRPA